MDGEEKHNYCGDEHEEAGKVELLELLGQGYLGGFATARVEEEDEEESCYCSGGEVNIEACVIQQRYGLGLM